MIGTTCNWSLIGLLALFTCGGANIIDPVTPGDGCSLLNGYPVRCASATTEVKCDDTGHWAPQDCDAGYTCCKIKYGTYGCHYQTSCA